MQSYRLTWTTPDGEPKVSAVSFSATAAERYRPSYAARAGVPVEIVLVDPHEGLRR
ncbi:hypothetical protein ABTY59_32065 [Streptomyces sp. NPDC096079]|uniref:hypothetical protein n=1 Tax=Streptomyces sp. NPDC096079 TaxID=3155820 RepID=UPI003328EEEC